MHCFSMPEQLDECLERGYCDLVRRQRHLPERRASSRRAARAGARGAAAGRDRRALPDAAGGPQAPQPAGLRGPHGRASSRELRGVRRGAARRGGGARTPRACSAGHERRGGRARASRACGACARFGVRPDRDLGQNFLIDSNILGVIGRAAELRAGGRRARDRRRPRRALASTSPSASPTCTWSRSTSACARRCSTPPRAHANVTRALGRRDERSTSRALEPAPDEGRREPALRDRRGRRCCARSRSCPAVRAVGGDGPARGGRAAGRRARQRRLRHAVGARPARLRGARSCGRSRAPSSSPCRTSTRCWCG